MCKYLAILCLIVGTWARVVYESPLHHEVLIHESNLGRARASSFSYRIDKFPFQKPLFYVPILSPIFLFHYLEEGIHDKVVLIPLLEQKQEADDKMKTSSEMPDMVEPDKTTPEPPKESSTSN